jgi:hypothetical protein
LYKRSINGELPLALNGNVSLPCKDYLIDNQLLTKKVIYELYKKAFVTAERAVNYIVAYPNHVTGSTVKELAKFKISYIT